MFTPSLTKRVLLLAAASSGATLWTACTAPATPPERMELPPETRIVLMGNGLGSRMAQFGHFETGMHLRYPTEELFIRNMADEGHTPSFRPHSGRPHQLGFPGAEDFHPPYTDGNSANAQGHFETEEEWLTKLRPDILIAFFGFNESFMGRAGQTHFEAELDAFVKHTLAQPYNGISPPELILVSPTAFQDLTATMDVPDGHRENRNLADYTRLMQRVAEANGLRFVDAFHPSLEWYERTAEPLTSDGALLNEAGYRKFSEFLIDQIFGGASSKQAEAHRTRVHELVMDKNWLWINDFKIPNGVHVFGRRYNPFGPDNYPFEVEKIREMTAIRDQAIWAAARGESLDIAALDAETSPLPAVVTNYNPAGRKDGRLTFLKVEEALATIQVPEGYKIEQWATEEEFPDLANPVQLTFDNQGRLWVATMPSYPHWRPGDPRPNDKLLILEDTNGDGKADTQTLFAEGLHLPMGFEITSEGVFVSQGPHLVLLRDTNGDGTADTREIIFSGFDDHDTHHAISAFASDPSGAIILSEGVFLRTHVETAYGPVRGSDGGFFRFNPQRRHLERHAQLSIPNPWGTAFDDWGQHFFLHTSGPQMQWMLPGTIQHRYSARSPGGPDLIEPDHRVRPTAGLEFLSSRHFPDEVQGDIMLNNTIGFLGTKQHQMLEDGTGYTTRFRQNLTQSSDGNFRPVDLEIAPDGSLYLVDWHNPLIGHMQHNARDPNRDHAHGRIYRVTYPGRPLLTPPPIHGAKIGQLLENLTLPEFRARERSRRELRGRDAGEVLAELATWVDALARDDPNHEHHLLEALWVTWGLNRIDRSLLVRVLNSEDHRARAAAVRVLRYAGHQISDQVDLLQQAARDPHGRVQLEAIVAASWLSRSAGLSVLAAAADPALEKAFAHDSWIAPVYRAVRNNLNNRVQEEETISVPIPAHLAADLESSQLYAKGAEVYSREGHCATCHQPNGRGIPAAGFPPLDGTRWVTQSEDRLIKLVLKGLYGPMEVKGESYSGLVPMTGFEGLLDDDEIAAVLTYTRNSFGNQASVISPAQVKRVREETRDHQGFFSPAELLELHPHQ
jgi:mono/diheme cytochrome c family protein/glucose/arabinose dehydrogenase